MERRKPLGPGRKAMERGSTFASQGKGLSRSPLKPATGRSGGTQPSTPRAPRKGFTPASAAQREKARKRGSVVSGDGPCDPAHLWPRSHGGCDHPDCIVPLTRMEHRAFDDGQLDLLPHLIAQGCWAELAHMVHAHHVDPIAMLNRLTGERWAPETRRAA